MQYFFSLAARAENFACKIITAKLGGFFVDIMAIEARQLSIEMLQAKGVTLNLSPISDGHLVSSTYQGITRELVIRSDQEARVFTPNETTPGIPRIEGVLLVITDKDRKTMRVAPLEYIPSASGESKIKQTTLAEFFDFSNYRGGKESAIKTLQAVLRQEGSVIVPRKGKEDISLTTIIDNAANSPNHAVKVFLQQQIDIRAGEILSDRPRLRRAQSTLSSSIQTDISPEETAAYVAASEEILQLRGEMFVEIGQSELHGLPLDMYSHNFLPQNREIALTWDRSTTLSFLQQHSPEDYQRLRHASLRVIQEGATIALAYEQARQEIIHMGENHATTKAMEKFVAQGKNKGRIIDEPESITPLSLVEWAQLPTQALILPKTNTENLSPRALAAVIFDEILFSPQVCDRQGEQVHMSPASRAAHIEKVAYAIEQGLPIEASQYTPFAAIGNPLKRETQNPTLAEVDMIRRLADVCASVELIYPPGLHWHVTNEVPAFQGTDMLDLDTRYVDRFHNEIARIVHAVDPQNKLITLHRLDTFLQGDRQKTAAWQNYWTEASATMDAILNDSTHPQHDSTIRELTTFAYPMATCTNPYRFEVARHLTSQEIMEVYQAIRSHTQSEIRGVSLEESENEQTTKLNSMQQQLFQQLLDRGLQMARTYRITMGSREYLKAFSDVLPPYTVAYTMVTKKDKPVLYPNSGRGAYFPAHGEPILVPSSQRHQRSTVTVRPAHQVTSSTSYKPVKDPRDSNNVLYWIQITR